MFQVTVTTDLKAEYTYIVCEKCLVRVLKAGYPEVSIWEIDGAWACDLCPRDDWQGRG